MNSFRLLPAGTRGLLIGLAGVGIATLAGEASHRFDLGQWGGIGAPQVWQGEIWRLISYVFIPAGLSDLLLGLVGACILGTQLEKRWLARDLWFFFLFLTLGVGLAKLILSPHGPVLLGTAPIFLGALFAWARQHVAERVQFFGGTDISIGTLIWITLGLNLVFGLSQRGPIGELLVRLSGVLVAWAYLAIRSRTGITPAQATLRSERIGRLEL